eukprot:212214_1
MTPKRGLGRNRLSESYRISTNTLEQKFTSDQWVLQQISPYNGSLHSPIIDPNGNIYVYRWYSVRDETEEDAPKYNYILQIFKLLSISFNIVWFQTINTGSVTSNDIFYHKSFLPWPQDITYYISNDPNGTTKEYLMADISSSILIINVTNGNILHKIPINVFDNTVWYLYNNKISVINVVDISSHNTQFRSYFNTYSIDTGNVISSFPMQTWENNYFSIYNNQYAIYEDTINDTMIIFSFQTNLTAMNVVNNELSILWQQKELYFYSHIIINDKYKRIYVTSITRTACQLNCNSNYLYSLDFDGNIVNRYILTKISKSFLAVMSGSVLSYDNNNLYLFMNTVGAGDTYLIHFSINNDDIVSEKTLHIDDEYGFNSMTIDKDNTLFLWFTSTDPSCMHQSQHHYKVFDKHLNLLWSQNMDHQFSLGHDSEASEDETYNHRTYTTFDVHISDNWYSLDAFFGQCESNNHFGYFKFLVYGPKNKNNIIYEWKFWVSVVIAILSFICFVVLQIYEKNTMLKKAININNNNYHRMSDDMDMNTDNNNKEEFLIHTKRIKILISISGLIILGILITIIHFEKIGTINTFLDTIGSYENVRKTYLVNAEPSILSSVDYQYKDLCFCTDSDLDITETTSGCNADHCFAQTYDCSDIIEYFGKCDLVWFKEKCDCTLNILEGCNITIDSNTTIPETLPHKLYVDCIDSYHLLYTMLWSIYGIHIGFSIIYILSAIATRFKRTKIGWITRISSIITTILIIIVSSIISDNICTGTDKLLGYNYVGCNYTYPDDFDQTFQQLEYEAYNGILGVVLLYGMKTVLKIIQVWMPFSCTNCTDACCLK